MVAENASTSKPSSSAVSASNRNFYRVHQTLDKFGYSKLPKNSHVLRRFLLELQQTGTIKAAAAKTASGLCEVWKFHFGLKLIIGKSTLADKGEDECMKLIIMTDKIEKKISDLYHEWKELEKSSKRKDRCMKDSFKEKENNFLEKLKLPMDITKNNPEEILRKSKIIEWKDDLIHLRQQLSNEQMRYDEARSKR